MALPTDDEIAAFLDEDKPSLDEELDALVALLAEHMAEIEADLDEAREAEIDEYLAQRLPEATEEGWQLVLALTKGYYKGPRVWKPRRGEENQP